MSFGWSGRAGTGFSYAFRSSAGAKSARAVCSQLLNPQDCASTSRAYCSVGPPSILNRNPGQGILPV
jgi:hypothetical protein